MEQKQIKDYLKTKKEEWEKEKDKMKANPFIFCIIKTKQEKLNWVKFLVKNEEKKNWRKSV